MIILWNAQAFICLLVALVVGVAVGNLVGSFEIGLFALFLSAMAVDLWMRLRAKESETLHPILCHTTGGHLWFVPIWAFAVVLTVLVALSHFRVI